MENDSSKLVNDLEKGDDFLNEIIESNREMDNLLLESDFALETAESDLKATSKDIPTVASEDDETSSALSIEVSDDLFKGFTSDINFSPLRYNSDKNKDSKFKECKLPDNLNNLLDDFNATLKSYNAVFQQDTDDNDKTLIPDKENTESSPDLNKTVKIKSLVTFDSEEENDYVYVDLFNTTLEITVPNNVDENLNYSPKATTLKHQNHFEGCSEKFDSKNIGNEFTVIVNTEKTYSKAENNNCKPIKTDIEELNSDEIPESIKSNNESDNNDPKADINNDFVEEITESNDEVASDDNITIKNVSEKVNNDFVEKITEPVNTNIDFTKDEINVSFDHIEQNENIYEVSKIGNEITSDDMSLTFRNFIQSELKTDTEEKSLPNFGETIHNYAHLQNVDVQIKEREVEITLNENNNVVQTLKRPAEDIITCEIRSKKQKLDTPATVTKETISESAKTNDPTSSKTNEITIVPDDPVLPIGDINFTQAIFLDHEETADNNDPKWLVLKDLETNEDYFNSVRTQWRSLSLPNPHKSNTTRYVPENIVKNKTHLPTPSENEQAISCGQFLDKRILGMSSDINSLVAKLNSHPRFKGRSERKRIHNDLEHLRNLQHEVEKNKEELKHINMFYYNAAQGWNANYLTRPELTELEEQDQVLKFQEKFYK